MYIQNVRPVNIEKYEEYKECRGVIISIGGNGLGGERDSAPFGLSAGTPYVKLPDGKVVIVGNGEFIVTNEAGDVVEVLASEDKVKEKYVPLNLMYKQEGMKVMSVRPAFTDDHFMQGFDMVKAVFSTIPKLKSIKPEDYTEGSTIVVNFSELDPDQAPAMCAAMMSGMIQAMYTPAK